MFETIGNIEIQNPSGRGHFDVFILFYFMRRSTIMKHKSIVVLVFGVFNFMRP